jgi:mannose-6-phosphate isomerase
LKVLAAAEPLSLQTHPTATQATAGFDRENAAGVPIDAPTRIYRDASAKPELICALTPFEALCGFRPYADSAAWFRSLGWDELAHRLDAGPAAFLRWALDEAPHRLPDGAPGWAKRIAGRYPGDGGVFVALLMNRLTLAPGQAIFLDAGNLHAYLQGVGVEIMSSSDNVVRGGLTDKHIDVDEVLAVVDLTPLTEPVVEATELQPGRWCYDTPNTPFRLWRWEIDDSLSHTSTGRELLLCTAGDAGPLAYGTVGYLSPGETVELAGPATVFRVEERLLG